MRKIIELSLNNSLFLNLLTFIVIIAGSLAAIETNKEAFPSVDFDTLSITTSYPGASPKEVEIQVTKEIENEIDLITGIEEYYSQSYENLSLIVVKLEPDLNDFKKNQKINQIQRAVDRVRLPSGVRESPIVTQLDSGVMPVLELSITGEMSYESLHKIAEYLKDEIKNLPDANAPLTYGYRDQEYWVELDPKKLEKYHVGLGEVIRAISTKNINLPAGILRSEDGDFLVRTIGEVESYREIDEIVLRTNLAGKKIYIKDVGRTRKTFSESDKYFRTNGKPSINLIIRKKVTGDIINLVHDVKMFVAEYQKKNPDLKLEVSFVNDMSVFVKNRLSVLISNGFMGMVLVLSCLLIFLSRGIALVSALGMPVALLGAVLVMNVIGLTINLLTLFALVIVLGMLVDDAIIVAENIWQHYERGKSPWDAAVDGTSEVFWPVFATILTTIAAFFPLLLVTGIFGKFIDALPKVIIISLVISLIEAMFILPAHAYDMLKIDQFFKKSKNRNQNVKKRINLDSIISSYEKVLRNVLNYRYIAISILVVMFTFVLWVQKTYLKTILFPNDGIEFFFIRANFQAGMSAKMTEKKLIPFEDYVKTNIPKGELKDYVTYVGMQQVDGLDPLRTSASHLGQVAIYLHPVTDRKRTADEIIDSIREDIEKIGKDIGAEKVYFTRQRLGPPVGKPVAVRLYGDDFNELSTLASDVQNILSTLKGVSDISSDYVAGKDEIQVMIDQQKSGKSLLSTQEIATHIRASLEGQIASYIQTSSSRTPIRVRYMDQVRNDFQTLKSSLVMNSVGQLVPMEKLATFNQRPGITSIRHRNGSRVITVSADVDEKITSSNQVNALILDPITKLEKNHPRVRFERGGEYEDTNKSMDSLRYSFLFAAALIFIILSTIFKSMTQPFVVMAAIPFGMIGIIVAFYLHQLPLSFLAFIGSIGLSGVVVNDSIVLVDFINKARAKGMNSFEAIIYAGKRRFRAVWLTSITTIFGLLPIAYGIGGQDAFLKPAAMAIGYGLIFATILILVLVPVLYMVRIDIINMFIWCIKPIANKNNIKIDMIK